MIFHEVTRITNGNVVGEVSVSFDIDSIEAKELRDALAIVDKYKKAAIKAIKEETKEDPTTSDWLEVHYQVKNNMVFVLIKDGMCGWKIIFCQSDIFLNIFDCFSCVDIFLVQEE